MADHPWSSYRDKLLGLFLRACWHEEPFPWNVGRQVRDACEPEVGGMEMLTVLSCVTIVFTAFAALWLLERIGRRIPLLVGGAICIGSVVAIGGVLKSDSNAVGTALVVLA